MRSLRVIAAVVAALTAPLLAAGPARAAGAIKCGYQLSTWPGGGFSADLRFTNHGPAIDGWTVRWTFPTATTIVTPWNAVLTQPTPYAMTAVNVSYNQVIATGQSVSFGWTGRAAATEVPTDITVNGMAC
jgi:hypothetical protein